MSMVSKRSRYTTGVMGENAAFVGVGRGYRFRMSVRGAGVFRKAVVPGLSVVTVQPGWPSTVLIAHTRSAVVISPVSSA